MRWLLLLAAACGGAQRGADPACLVEAPLGSDAPRGDTHYFHVDLATGRVQSRDHTADTDAVAAVEGDEVVVRRGGREILRARHPDSDSLAWQVERDGVLYFGTHLAHHTTVEGEAFQAIRLAAAPHVSLAWCRVVRHEHFTAQHVFAAATGPLLVHELDRILAIDRATGAERWRLPWPDAVERPYEFDQPPALRPYGDGWLACDRDIARIDLHGRFAWRREIRDVTTACYVVGDRVLFASRACGTDCVPRIAGALDGRTGTQLWTAPALGGQPLVALDGDHMLVAVEGGVAILDLRTAERGAVLALPSRAWDAELLGGGDALVRGDHETARITTAPLAVVWHAAVSEAKRYGDLVLAAEATAHPAAAWLSVIAPATGEVRRIPIEHDVHGEYGTFDYSSARIERVAGDGVDVATEYTYEGDD